MIHSVRFIVVLDTNVIYPVIVRDLLFWFAHYDMYTLKWSKHIFDEWQSVMERKGVPIDEAKKRIHPQSKMENGKFANDSTNQHIIKDNVRLSGVEASQLSVALFSASLLSASLFSD